MNAYNLQTVLLEKWFNEMVNVLYTELVLDTVQCTGGKMVAVFLLTDTCVAAAHASGFAPCT
jgi:hypothetical protein